MNTTISPHLQTLAQEITQTRTDYSKRFDFNPLKTYQPGNTFLLAQLNRLVYENDEGIHHQLDKWKTAHPTDEFKWRIVSVAEYKCLLFTTPRYLICCFRGTGGDLKNWIKTWLHTNLQMELVPYLEGNGKVHKGFYSSVKAMKEGLFEAFEKLGGPKKMLFLTGHSLGAAQAVLAGDMLPPFKGFNSITTFGQPKVGNKDFVKYLDPSLNSAPPSKKSRYFNIDNLLDPVPYLPIFYQNDFYYHAGEFYLNSLWKGSCYQINTTRKGKNSLFGSLHLEDDLEGALNFLIYHTMDYYLFNASVNRNTPVFPKNHA